MTVLPSRIWDYISIICSQYVILFDLLQGNVLYQPLKVSRLLYLPTGVILKNST